MVQNMHESLHAGLLPNQEDYSADSSHMGHQISVVVHISSGAGNRQN